MDQAINHIIFLYWNNQISQEQMLEYLQDVPPKILAKWIDSLVNRIDDAMKFATLSDRVEYPEGRVLPEKDIHMNAFWKRPNASASTVPSKTGLQARLWKQRLPV